MLTLVLFLLVSVTRLIADPGKQITNKTVFPLNEYLTTENGNPYPVLVQSKLDAIDTSKFVNVMDYGAKGDGITWDDDAIEKAFNDARYGVIFPSGKTFLVHKYITINLDRNMTVIAYGAVIKMDNLSRYSFLSLEYPEGSYQGTAIWLGGRLWGNKNYQSWPGSPTGDNTWAEDHGRFLGICNANFALVKDVTVVGPVMDGVGLEACKIAVIADSRAWAGAPIRYDKDGDQGTYFKCTRSGSQAFYCMNLSCDGGSIGVHYSTKHVEDGSLTVVTNSRFNNQTQDALHFEDCKKIFMYKCSVSRGTKVDYQADVHISNSAEVVSIKSCNFKNARVDFRNASKLEIGVIDSCQFVSEFADGDGLSLETCLAGATHCINSSFTGMTDTEQAWADYVQNCTFINFKGLALRGSRVANSSHFANGPDPISPAKDGLVENCSYDNVGNSDYRKPNKDDKDWQAPFSSAIDIVSDNNKYLGRINCGSVDENILEGVTGILTGTVDTVINILDPLVSSTVATARVAAPTGNSSAKKKSSNTTFNLDTAHHQSIAINSAAEATLNNKKIDLQSSAIKLYPNPTIDVIHVTLNDKVWGKTVLNIYDVQGRLVQSKTVYKNTASSTETINVNNLTSGSYVLQIINEQYKSSLKFIVAK